MRHASLAAALLLAVVHAHSAFAQSGEHALVREAIEAAGGEPALRALKTIEMRANSTHWEPDESLVAGGAPRMVGESTFTLRWDLANGMARTDWQRSMMYPSIRKMTYSEVVTPKFGFVTDAQGDHAMSGMRLAAQLRELTRMSPWLLLALHDHPANVTPEGGVRVHDTLLPAVAYQDGATKFWVMFDRKTHLPAFVRTHDDDAVRGTVIFDLRLDDWKPIAGAMVAHRLTYMIGDTVAARMLYTQVNANPTFDANIFASGVSKEARGPASGFVPYQWVLRHLFMGALLDSEQIFVPQGGSLKLVDLAPNVAHVVGGPRNSLMVAMKDGVVVFDAPINDAQSRWTMDAARAKFGKPVKYLVLTHHHLESSGGVRAYMAEGVKVIVPDPDRKYFARVALTQHVVPDELEKRRVSADITEIKDDFSLKDDGGEIHLYRITNPHAEAMLIASVMPGNVVWQSDLWTPGSDATKTPGAAALASALKRLGISSAIIAGSQGGVGKQADLEAIAGGD